MEGKSNLRPWDDMIPEVLGLTFAKLNLREILQVITLVCKSWCRVVEGPYCWQRIAFRYWQLRKLDYHDRMLRMLITRSSGSLRELCTSSLQDEDMLSFIAEHAISLRTLKLEFCFIMDQVATKFSSITCLDLHRCVPLNAQVLGAFGRNCKMLVSLSFKRHQNLRLDSLSDSDADDVCAIADTMPKLKHLSAIYLEMNTKDYLKLLSGCPELEFLDICGWKDFKIDVKLLEEKYPKIRGVSPKLFERKREDDERLEALIREFLPDN